MVFHVVQRIVERVSLTTIRELLESGERAALDERLSKAAKSGSIGETQMEIRRLLRGIEESFTFCCPNDGCGGTIDGRIEGCNAAACSNDECKATFCYLCLKPKKDGRTAHQHVQEHSGDYWERRPGYTERYHWLVARKNLADLFRRKVSKGVRAAAVESRKAILQERKMWPLPAGLMSREWIQEVKNTHLPHDQVVELLQNEFIYRYQEENSKDADVVKAELQRLGAPVLASLDVRDAGGMYPHERVGQNAANRDGGVVLVVPVARPPAERLIPVMEGDERVRGIPAFVRLGSMYQVGNVIWSGVPKREPPRGFFNPRVEFIVKRMKEREAEQYCRNLGGGARLPVREEYEALGRAMGAPHHYDRNAIPDMAQNYLPPHGMVHSDFYFWLLSGHIPSGLVNATFFFNGNSGGFVGSNPPPNEAAVRCVLPVH